MKTLIVAIFVVASSTSAIAAMPQAPVRGDADIRQMSANCGNSRYYWVGPGGHCYPRAKAGTCPSGYHAKGRYCWPNA